MELFHRIRPSRRGHLYRLLQLVAGQRGRDESTTESARRVRRDGRHRHRLDHLGPAPVRVPRRAVRQSAGPREPIQSTSYLGLCHY